MNDWHFVEKTNNFVWEGMSRKTTKYEFLFVFCDEGELIGPWFDFEDDDSLIGERNPMNFPYWKRLSVKCEQFIENGSIKYRIS